MEFEYYTIRQFMNAWFKGNRDVMSKEIFDEVYTQYIDTTGLYENEEFDAVGNIHYLNGRVNGIKMAIDLQRRFVKTFDIPFLRDLEYFKKYGHIIFWNNDKEKFLDALNKVESKEKKYISQLENAIKTLFDNRLKKNKGEEHTKEQTRTGFIKTINSLGKIGFQIDYDKTTVEELAIMIRQQMDEVEALKNKQKPQ